jgi:hypothetical protein
VTGSNYPGPGEGLPYLFFRTTPRDRWLLAMLGEHRLLTAAQINVLCFARARRMNERLTQLRQLELVGRFRTQAAPWQGSHCYRYILGPAGATLVAAAHDLTPKEFGYNHAKLLRQQARADLAHTVGLHDALSGLAARGELSVWWNQYSLLPVWGDLIRPDAYAVHRDPVTGGEFGFFLEHDTGSEHLPQLAAKTAGYRRYAATYRGHRPILIHLSSHAREHALHQRLAASLEEPLLPMATAVTTPAERDANAIQQLGMRLAGPAWKPLGADVRVALAELSGYFTGRGVTLLPAKLEDRDIRAPAPACPSLTQVDAGATPKS